MGRPQRISDREIALAARRAFLEEGPHLTVGQIAARLGVSAAALFQRAGPKAQLMISSLSPGDPPGLDALRRGPASDVLVTAQLKTILGELLAFFRDVVPSLIVLRSAKLFPQKTEPRPTTRPPMPVLLRQLLARWLADAAAEGRVEIRSPRACAEGLLGAIEARCFNAHIGGASYVKLEDDAFLDELIAGLVGEVES